MTKRRRQKKQSLTKNVALLFLSLGILAGASILFSTVSGSSDFSYDPLRGKLASIISLRHEGKSVQTDEAKKKKSQASSYDYKYWDILLLQEKAEPPGDNKYTIQIAAFKSLKNAQNYAHDLKDKTHLQCRVVSQGDWSVVRWGSFSKRSSAERYRKKLSERLQKECIIIKM